MSRARRGVRDSERRSGRRAGDPVVDEAPETEVRRARVSTGSAPAVPAPFVAPAADRPGRRAGAGAGGADCQLRLSLKAYLQQRQHIAELKAEIAQSEADIDALEREKARWRDPAYVQSQARARFGYVMPGETSYVVLGADGKPLEAETSLRPRQEVLAKEPTAWFETAWNSVLLAGNPPAPEEKPKPLDQIDAPKQ